GQALALTPWRLLLPGRSAGLVKRRRHVDQVISECADDLPRAEGVLARDRRDGAPARLALRSARHQAINPSAGRRTAAGPVPQVRAGADEVADVVQRHLHLPEHLEVEQPPRSARMHDVAGPELDRKSTRLNSSHGSISYAVFCLKKKNKRPTKSRQRR